MDARSVALLYGLLIRILRIATVHGKTNRHNRKRSATFVTKPRDGDRGAAATVAVCGLGQPARGGRPGAATRRDRVGRGRLSKHGHLVATATAAAAISVPLPRFMILTARGLRNQARGGRASSGAVSSVSDRAGADQSL